eukprot:TRINITY_DN8408_c0_g1_i2.p1 TRINITY_DN8408_c0_g1~~TRINITY_DN8408_c0_g1_i2.p1  ORF type:complete len:468 (+),score=68.05 TRINITY_DN8408_c0_g1_i2:117-1520(+)
MPIATHSISFFVCLFFQNQHAAREAFHEADDQEDDYNKSFSWDDMTIFFRFTLANLCVVFLLYGVPLSNMEDMKIVNVEFFELLISAVATSFCVCPLWHTIIMTISSPSQDVKPWDNKRLVIKVVCAALTVGFLCWFFVGLTIYLGKYPIPFSGPIIGVPMVVILFPILALWIYRREQTPPPTESYHATLHNVFLVMNLAAAIVVAQQFLIVGIYFLGNEYQLYVLAAYQITGFMMKQAQRILIRKKSAPFGFSRKTSDALVLSFNVRFEYDLQLFVMLVSPQVGNTSTLILYLFAESCTLALGPIFDSDTGRKFLKRILISILPMKKDAIENMLTIKSRQNRILALQNCALNHYIRVLSSIVFLLLGSFFYYSYNSDYFPTYNVGHSHMVSSFIFACSSIPLAIIQFLIIRHICKRIYRFDILYLGAKAIRDEFSLIFCHLIEIYAHAIIVLLVHHNSTAYLLKVV